MLGRHQAAGAESNLSLAFSLPLRSAGCGVAGTPRRSRSRFRGGGESLIVPLRGIALPGASSLGHCLGHGLDAAAATGAGARRRGGRIGGRIGGRFGWRIGGRRRRRIATRRIARRYGIHVHLGIVPRAGPAVTSLAIQMK